MRVSPSSRLFRLVVIGAALFLLSGAAAGSRLHEPQAPAPGPRVHVSPDDDAIDEAPEPTTAAERAERDAKNARYDSVTSGQDLTLLPPGVTLHAISCGIADGTILPTASHDVIVLGTVRSAQPYLSANRTAVYTEYHLAVEEVFKPASGERALVSGDLVVDRPGGVIRRRDGHVIASTEQDTSMARPLDVGRRYVLFCTAGYEKQDLVLGPAFELRDGRAYAVSHQLRAEDRLVGELEGAVAELSEESRFLEAVRDAVAHPSSPRYFSAPRR